MKLLIQLVSILLIIISITSCQEKIDIKKLKFDTASKNRKIN